MFAGFLVLTMTVACATENHLSVSRAPAADLSAPPARLSPALGCETLTLPSERHFCALVAKDAIEALGLMVTDRILGARLEKMRLELDKTDRASSGGSVAAVQQSRSNDESTSKTLSGSIAFRPNSGEDPLLFTKNAGDGLPLVSMMAMSAGAGTIFWRFGMKTGNGPILDLGKKALIAAGVVAVAHGSTMGRSSKDVSSGPHTSIIKTDEIKRQGLRNRSSFRLGEPRPPANALAAQANRLTYERRLREVAREMADQAAKLFDLNKTLELRLAAEIEREIRRRIESDPAPATGIESSRVLGAMGVDVRSRLAALNAILAEAPREEARFVASDAIGQRVEALGAIDHRLAGMVARGEKYYAELDGDGSERPTALLAETLRFIDQCEALRARIRVQLTLAAKANEGEGAR